MTEDGSDAAKEGCVDIAERQVESKRQPGLNRPTGEAREIVRWIAGTFVGILCVDPGGKTLLDLGFDSLKTVLLQYQLQANFNVTVSLQQLLDGRTLDQLAESIARDPQYRRDGDASIAELVL
jgi:acyl carrier protein